LALIICLSLCSCSEDEYVSSKTNEPYRNVTFGMTISEVKELEKGLSSTYMEGDEERILYEAYIEGDLVRIGYWFVDGKLEHFKIIADPDFGTDNYLEFYDNFKKTLNSLYDTIQVDGQTYWVNDCQTIGAETQKTELFTNASFVFLLKEPTAKTH